MWCFSKRSRAATAVMPRAWPTTPAIRPQYAYGRNAVYADGHHGNAVLSKFPISHVENRDISIAGPERRGLLHCVLEAPQGQIHAVCVHLGLLEAHRRRQMQMLCDLVPVSYTHLRAHET